MKDITEYIKIAISKDLIWSAKIFLIVIEKIKSAGYNISFWEDEENWATVFEKDKIIGYVWRKYPVFFYISKYELNFKEILKEYESSITLIKTISLIDKEFKIKYDELKEYLDYGINYNSFSVEELWFNSNSI